MLGARVSHDFATMLLNYNYPPTQDWFDNGIVEYFSSLRIDGRQVEIGGDPELRITTGSGEQSKVSYTSAAEVLNTQPWLKLPDFGFDQTRFGKQAGFTARHLLRRILDPDALPAAREELWKKLEPISAWC